MICKDGFSPKVLVENTDGNYGILLKYLPTIKLCHKRAQIFDGQTLTDRVKIWGYFNAILRPSFVLSALSLGWKPRYLV